MMLDRCIAVLLVAFFAIGFRALILATPLKKIRSKPFSCDTCLVGWGSLLGILLINPEDWTWQSWSHSAFILFQMIAATGLARLLVVRFDMRGLLAGIDMEDPQVSTGTASTLDSDDPVVETGDPEDGNGNGDGRDNHDEGDDGKV